ncbi:hypothetical protein FQA39_LY02869 [Lamprigera yunnana]|nr:hypothetical protein FQA39_LY02869 [Lamprigera yunnana]
MEFQVIIIVSNISERKRDVVLEILVFPTTTPALGGQGGCCINFNFLNNSKISEFLLPDGIDTNTAYGLSKRLERFRIANRDENYDKRRGAALDSLVAGGMFGKAKRNEYDYSIKEDDIDKFQRNIRPLLNTMELGGSFGRAIKRQVLDTLGSNAFGVQKRRVKDV